MRRYGFWVLLWAVLMVGLAWMLLGSSGICACYEEHAEVVTTTPAS